MERWKLLRMAAIGKSEAQCNARGFHGAVNGLIDLSDGNREALSSSYDPPECNYDHAQVNLAPTTVTCQLSTAIPRGLEPMTELLS